MSNLTIKANGTGIRAEREQSDRVRFYSSWLSNHYTRVNNAIFCSNSYFKLCTYCLNRLPGLLDSEPSFQILLPMLTSTSSLTGVSSYCFTLKDYLSALDSDSEDMLKNTKGSTFLTRDQPTLGHSSAWHFYKWALIQNQATASAA